MRAFKIFVDENYKNMNYRPVGVAILYRDFADRKFLLVQSAKDPDSWSFPQGGIERGETEEQNLAREMKEELGIDFEKEVAVVSPSFDCHYLDAEPGRKDKRGFTKGKAYYFSVGRYIGKPFRDFTLQPEEVADAKWLTYQECLEYFNKGRPEKAEVLKEALDYAIREIEMFEIREQRDW